MESSLPGLLSESPRERLQTALELLNGLAEADAVALATPQKALTMTADESTQLNRILDVLHRRFADPLKMQDLCAAGNLSERSLHRLFVRHLGQNPSDYLGKLRIGRACMWLAETERPISVIAADAGFSNLSNFNRRFRAERKKNDAEGVSPMLFAYPDDRFEQNRPNTASALFGKQGRRTEGQTDPRLPGRAIDPSAIC